jgi:hypothetical protein
MALTVQQFRKRHKDGTVREKCKAKGFKIGVSKSTAQLLSPAVSVAREDYSLQRNWLKDNKTPRATDHDQVFLPILHSIAKATGVGNN